MITLKIHNYQSFIPFEVGDIVKLSDDLLGVIDNIIVEHHSKDTSTKIFIQVDGERIEMNKDNMDKIVRVIL